MFKKTQFTLLLKIFYTVYYVLINLCYSTILSAEHVINDR